MKGTYHTRCCSYLCRSLKDDAIQPWEQVKPEKFTFKIVQDMLKYPQHENMFYSVANWLWQVTIHLLSLFRLQCSCICFNHLTQLSLGNQSKHVSNLSARKSLSLSIRAFSRALNDGRLAAIGSHCMSYHAWRRRHVLSCCMFLF